MSDPFSVADIFNTKYDDFCRDLEGLHPVLDPLVFVAKGLSVKDRVERFAKEVSGTLPGAVLPDVVISKKVWKNLGEKNQEAIKEHVKVLKFCIMMQSGHDLSGSGAEKILEEMKEKLKGFNFEDIAKKFASMFSDVSGAEGDSKFKLPERFLKGQIAKLAEEIVREIKPEDLGLTEEQLKECEKNPSKALEILMTSFTGNPVGLQGAMMRVVKRLQEKFKRGEFRLEQLKAEAEELIKEFSENSSFVDMMEQFRSAFGFEDMDLARQAGREGSARLALVRERLKKKLEKRASK